MSCWDQGLTGISTNDRCAYYYGVYKRTEDHLKSKKAAHRM